MSTPSTAVSAITADHAARLYGASESNATGIGSALSAGLSDGVGGGGPSGFGAVLGRALEGAVATGQEAERQSAAAISGRGNVTEVVTAVAKADLALQTTMAIRDRVVQAYQDVMRMPI